MYGIDVLGFAKYQDLVVREWPSGWACGVFANTFGNVWPGLTRLLETGRCPETRIQAMWDNNHQYRPREHDRIIMKELEQANQLKTAFPHVEVQFSYFCEHNIKGQQLRDLIAKCRAKARGVTLVNSFYQGDFVPGMLNEVHGSHSAPKGDYNYSDDGTHCVDSNVTATTKKHSRAKTRYFWFLQCNGKVGNEGKPGKTPVLPPKQRQGWPTAELLDSVIYLHRDQGAVNLSSRHLWKSHGDQHSVPVPEPRAGKPVFITPVDAKEVQLVADNGQVVAVMPRDGKFTDGRPKYRLDMFGFIAAEKAVRIHGKPTVKLVANGKVIGVVNPAFRAGSFR